RIEIGRSTRRFIIISRVSKEPYKSAVDFRWWEESHSFRIVGVAAHAITIASHFVCGYGNRKAGQSHTDGELDGMCAGVGAGCLGREAVEGCDDGGIWPREEHATLRLAHL